MNLKKIVLLASILVLTLNMNSYGASIPQDVTGQPYEKAVATLFGMGIITGDENGKFNPNQTLTRAQACIIVVKSMNPPIDQVMGTATQDILKSGFPDMSGYSWAEGYIGYAVRKGVTKGYSDGSFKPGNNVTTSEFVTMLLRAAGHSDDSLGGKWPYNYENLAEGLNLYDGVLTLEEMPIFATKWMAAQMGYNSLMLIEKANINESEAYFGTPEKAPDMTEAEFSYIGKFNHSMTSYAGIPLAEKAVVYTYGNREEYDLEMKFSSLKSDYNIESIYKYKDVITPAFFEKENNEIVKIVLPINVGYTGNVFCVINGLSNGVDSITASRSIKWEYKQGIRSISMSSNISDGTVYQLKVENGKIIKFAEIKDLLSGYGIVEDYIINGPIKIKKDEVTSWYDVSESPTIYINDKDKKPNYISGNISAIKTGSLIKLYDISDNEQTEANIIIVREK